MRNGVPGDSMLLSGSSQGFTGVIFRDKHPLSSARSPALKKNLKMSSIGSSCFTEIVAALKATAMATIWRG